MANLSTAVLSLLNSAGCLPSVERCAVRFAVQFSALPTQTKRRRPLIDPARQTRAGDVAGLRLLDALSRVKYPPKAREGVPAMHILGIKCFHW
ncbi:hypothetical protein VZT92_010624 [Zoarces viviparus]|uniref:Uncharacterized protein n=1 Tax=Zoarces viviparus TaxID=48416 RepID=A0AAW1F8V2_ZOAVI